MALPLNQLAYAEIVIKGAQAAGGSNGKNCYNVFCYKRANLALALTEAQVAAAFITTVVTPLVAAANIRYSVQNIGVRFIDDPTRMMVDTASALVGAIATDPQPQQNTVVCILKTAYRGSSGRGIKRFGAVNEVDTTADILTGAGLTRWQAVQTALAANLNDASTNVWTPYVLSRKYSDLQLLPAATIWANPVTSVVLDKQICTLRRRKASPVH